jgi:excisionase family DNA binding protein
VEVGASLEDLGEAAVDRLIDALDGFVPVVGHTDLGWAEVSLGLDAGTVAQAVTMGVALVAGALEGHEVTGVRALTEAEWNLREQLSGGGDAFVSVAEAAARRGVTPTRIRQLLAAHRLPGRKVGRTWLVDPAGLPG